MADATLDLATVWDQIRERLATSLSPQQNAMLNLTRPLGLVEDTAVLAAPNEFTQTVLESRMRRVLAEALSEQFGRDIRVAVQLEDAPAGPPADAARRGADPPSLVGGRGAARRGGPGHPGPRRRRAQRVRRADRRRRHAAVGPRRPASAPAGRRRGPRAAPGRRPAAHRAVDRGAPEDWSTTDLGDRPADAGRATATGAARTSASADVLPFDLDARPATSGGRAGNGGRDRRRGAATAPAGSPTAGRPAWTRG